MTFSERTVIAILLLVARMLAEEEWAAQIKALANSIAVHREPREEAGDAD